MKIHPALHALFAVALMTAGLQQSTIAAEGGHDHGHDAHAPSITSLSLDNGEKWLMDAHTRAKMAEMESAFYSADHNNQQSLNSLGQALQQDLDQLISGCTMQGKAHDQLHVFLTDYIPTVQAMSSADNLESARTQAISLKGQLDNYKKHFK